MNATWPGGAPQVARIGPNAITRVGEALLERCGGAVTRALFQAAGIDAYLDTPPPGMVDESEVARLHRALRRGLRRDVARQVTHSAGLRTADYLLAHRIPRPVQWLLKRLPAGAAARLLLSAIRRHAWTFSGSGVFEARGGHPVVLTIRRNPLCLGVRDDEPVCHYYAATFERLFRVLVHPQSRAIETACEARGDPLCRFEVRWRG